MDGLLVIIIVIAAGLFSAAGKREAGSERAGKTLRKVRASGMSKLAELQRYARGESSSLGGEGAQEILSSPRARSDGRISTLSELFQDDRRGDWLARQIREESKRTVWNNFSDIGAMHEVICAADLNRRAHRAVHEEGVVDDGENS